MKKKRKKKQFIESPEIASRRYAHALLQYAVTDLMEILSKLIDLKDKLHPEAKRRTK